MLKAAWVLLWTRNRHKEKTTGQSPGANVGLGRGWGKGEGQGAPCGLVGPVGRAVPGGPLGGHRAISGRWAAAGVRLAESRHPELCFLCENNPGSELLLVPTLKIFRRHNLQKNLFHCSKALFLVIYTKPFRMSYWPFISNLDNMIRLQKMSTC